MRRLGWVIACLAVVCSTFYAFPATPKKSATPSAAVAAASGVQEALKITQGPCLQAPSETGMTIVWATNKNCLPKVEYGTSSSAMQIAFSARHGLLDANTTLHRIRLSGLKPGAKYYYRPVSTEIVNFQAYKVDFGETIRSGVYSFTTPDKNKDSFSFVVLNDRHDKVDPLQIALGSIKWPGVDLVVLNGDMMSDLRNEAQVFRSVVGPCVKAFATTIPFVYVRGNHEARGYFARMLMDYFPTDSGRYYFSFDHGPVHFIVLDCGEDKSDTSKEYSGLVDFDRYRDRETDWLKAELRSEACRKAAFRVVFLHMPPNTSSSTEETRHGAEYIKQKWVPLLNAAKIDLMISGHTHRYAIVKPKEGQSFPIVVGGIDTIIRADVTPRQINVTSAKNDGTEFDKLTVVKKRKAPAWLAWLGLGQN